MCFEEGVGVLVIVCVYGCVRDVGVVGVYNIMLVWGGGVKEEWAPYFNLQFVLLFNIRLYMRTMIPFRECDLNNTYIVKVSQPERYSESDFSHLRRPIHRRN